jgi:phosphoribosyl-dephospho-CoA transferase
VKPASRNQLVWISDSAWQEIEAAQPDAQAREIVGHWRAKHLPLVVRRQPDDVAAGRLALGLPAPLRWARRKLAFDVSLDAVQMVGAFPTLLQVARRQRSWRSAAVELSNGLVLARANVRVYGSHGWQALTGEKYLHRDSDIDLHIEVPNVDVARAATNLLQAARLPRRLDGELVFPDGSSIAWREFDRVLALRTTEILVKSLRGPRLVTAASILQMQRSTR